ncbi:MAG TPA: glycosyltransferase family 39 protein, partial [Acidobacteriota bacterium]|nr:glycosyltransferase family 39 protein [Acidobacteriota bacterium]
LLVRLIVGAGIYYMGYIGFFAADADTYDVFGWMLTQYWAGNLHYGRWIVTHISRLGFNGMYYWVAGIYTIIGHSPATAAAIQCVITSFTPVLVYRICYRIYGSAKAARYAALLTAFLPSMVIWSCLLLKDALVVFLVCVSVLFTLKVQQDLKLRYLIPGSAAMLLIFPLRGYVFYFVLLAVVGTLLLARFGRTTTLSGYLTRLGGMTLVAVLLFALGFDEIAKEQINARLLDQVQISRMDLARTARTGFEASADVSTLREALKFLPRGLMYLLFAPFPWQTGSTRMMLALPETLIWYALFPFCLLGLVYTARKHLRDAMIIFLFVVQLTCFYAVFVGNAGTAHRQRTQVYVFYLVFTSAGLVYSRRRNRQIFGTIHD